ncbi:isochorismatase [Acinetobacter sp. ME22]|uniref:isochorismatase family protein n=1 Tax=Acinetobacter sp. ME22 TaxID=2904802 RepID=UPI001EDAEEB2|nr:isochorismatase [Acinetobacter sp. ME22]MCG2572186.1 isochorismatase [Acinetobacter sp. ME22]
MAIPRIASYPMPEIAQFHNNKVNWQADAKRAVLLVHDMQQYFLDFYDQTQAPIPELVAHTQALIELAHAQQIPVVYTAQPGNQTPEHRQLLSDFWGKGLQDDPQITRILPSVAPQPQDIVLTKWRYSAFKFSDLEDLMQEWQRDQLMICGVYAHIGCLTSALEAFMLNIQAFLIGDALADFSQAEHEMALNYVAQRCGHVLSTAELSHAWKKTMPEDHSTFSSDQIRQLVAKQLNLSVTDMEDEDDLLMLGLDSVQLMSLVSHWNALGAGLSFEELAESPTLHSWIQKLSKTASAS